MSASVSRRTGWHWCPGIRPPARGENGCGNAPALPDSSATVHARAATARQNPPGRRGRRFPGRRDRLSPSPGAPDRGRRRHVRRAGHRPFSR